MLGAAVLPNHHHITQPSSKHPIIIQASSNHDPIIFQSSIHQTIIIHSFNEPSNHPTIIIIQSSNRDDFHTTLGVKSWFSVPCGHSPAPKSILLERHLRPERIDEIHGTGELVKADVEVLKQEQHKKIKKNLPIDLSTPKTTHQRLILIQGHTRKRDVKMQYGNDPPHFIGKLYLFHWRPYELMKDTG